MTWKRFERSGRFAACSTAVARRDDWSCDDGCVSTTGILRSLPRHVEIVRPSLPVCLSIPRSSTIGQTTAYPRDEPRDIRLAAEAGVDYLFAPSVEEMYPPDFATWVDMEGPARGLEGDFRPGHFRGVATVCLKLFTIVRPHVAYFGQKDAQQVAVIKQLVRDLNLGLEIRVIPTVREPDGLALSSRNARLSPSERARALAIVRALGAGLAAHRAGADPVAAARAALADLEPDYVEVAEFNGQPTLAIATRVGKTRLIDNIPLDAAEAGDFS